VQAPDVWDWQCDEHEVEDYVWNGATKVYVSGLDAFCANDGDVPGCFDRNTGEDYAEELHSSVSLIFERYGM
jgi:hypothetical protein